MKVNLNIIYITYKNSINTWWSPVESSIFKRLKTKDIDQKGFGDLQFNFQNINRAIIKDLSLKNNYIVSFEFIRKFFGLQDYKAKGIHLYY
jgi:hypothetical protein